MRYYLAPLLILAIAGTALAGGGGTKANKKIIVKNLGADMLAVIVTEGTPYAGSLDPDEFENNGGKFLNTGEMVTFKVKKGSQFISGLYFNDATGVMGPPDALAVTVGNSTVRVEVRGDVSVAPTFIPVSSF